jgi:hypothetical protein
MSGNMSILTDLEAQMAACEVNAVFARNSKALY